MRPARLAVLPFVAALLLSGCGGGGQATRPFGPAKLVAETRAAASGQHSAHFHVVTVQHRHALPAGMTAGPYGLILRGAVTSDDGGRADVHMDLREPGVRISRRAGRKDVIAGDLDLGAITRDLVTLLRQAHAPRQDAALVRYVIGSLANTSWTLTFDHRSHLIEGLHARAEMRFQSDILQKYGIAEPFGLPRAVTGLTITLAAHLTHWGASVHVNAPALSTPLPDPGLLRSAV